MLYTCIQLLSCVRLFATSWTAAHQAQTLSMGFPSQEYWSVLPSVQSLSHVRLFATPWISPRQASLSITNSRSSLRLNPSSQWCHPAISSSVVLFSSCPQSLPASESFPRSQLFAWGGQSTGVSALTSFLPKKSQGWSPLEWTGWISLQSQGLSRVFSNTTVQKHQFFSAQPSSQSNSHIHTWPQENIPKILHRLLADFNSLFGGSVSRESVCNAGDQILSLGMENPLDKEMATHSSILAWRIPWIEETGGLQPMELQRVAHYWATNTFSF